MMFNNINEPSSSPTDPSHKCSPNHFHLNQEGVMFMQMCIHGFNISEQTVRFLKLEEAKKKTAEFFHDNMGRTSCSWKLTSNSLKFLMLNTYIAAVICRANILTIICQINHTNWTSHHVTVARTIITQKATQKGSNHYIKSIKSSTPPPVSNIGCKLRSS